MLVIYAEKASLAKEIASALNAGSRICNASDKRVGHWEFEYHGEKAVIVHGQGHLVRLSEPIDYGQEYGNWNLSVYPCIPDKFSLRVKENTESCFNYVKGFFEHADWLINATDPDREGELIFDYVYQKLNCKLPWKRVWIEDLTAQKIRYAFEHLKDGTNMRSLQLAGEARSISDWLFGMNITVAMTEKFSNHNGVLACGRVQTPTLALVVERENQIKNFQKKPFYKVIGKFTCTSGVYTGEFIDGNFDNSEAAQAIKSKAAGQGVIKSVTDSQKKISVPLLYNSTKLQATCAKILNWDLKKAESVMQQLYEAKYMSYPRTSSEHLTVAMENEIEKIIDKIMNISEYSDYSIPKEQWHPFSKRHFDDEKVGSHPAITPTLNVPSSLSEISDDDMRALYDLICKSMLRIVYPSAVLKETKIITSVNGVDFSSSGSTISEAGWYCVDAMPDKKNILPSITENDTVAAEISVVTGETKPPARYTEADLISAMELAGQKIDNEEARTLMKLQKKGLGTDATRVPTIKALFAREYIAKKGKTVYPTEKGRFIIDTLPVPEMKSAEMTGELEKELNDIYLGKADFDEFIKKVKALTLRWYEQVCNSAQSGFVNKKMICPACGSRLIKGKKNIFCSNYKNGCKFSVPYEICHKKLTENQMQMLINSQRTNVIKGFTSKSGKSFDCSLKIDNNGKIEFVFPQGAKKK